MITILEQLKQRIGGKTFLLLDDLIEFNDNLGLEINEKIDLISEKISERIDEIENNFNNFKIDIREELKIDPESIRGPKGDSIKGDKGDNYILTEKDKKDIANKIKIPIVEKIIEKTEIIKEQPIIKTEIKEVAALPDIEEIVKEVLQKISPRIRNSQQFGGGRRDMWIIETPVGTIDGSNQSFTISTNIIPDSEIIISDGIPMRKTRDYTLAGKTLTMNVAPSLTLDIKYQKL